MSVVNIDGDAIDPIVPQNMLLLNKPIYQVSEWESTTATIISPDEIIYFRNHINLAKNIVKSDLKDNYTPFSNVSEGRSGNFTDGFKENKILQLDNKAKGVKFKIKKIKARIVGGYAGRLCGIYLGYGKEIGTAKIETLFYRTLEENDVYIDLSDKEYELGDLNRGDSVWLTCFLYHVKNTNDFNDNPTMYLEKSDFSISATSYSYNSITPTFRLIDVMRQVVKSISGLDIIAPKFDIDGEFHDNRVFNGNFLRGITDRGFKVSLKDLEDSLMELNCDYEIAHDDLKGEITLIGAQWRCSVITNTNQGELDV